MMNVFFRTTSCSIVLSLFFLTSAQLHASMVYVAMGDSAAFGQIRIAQLRAGTLGDVRSDSAGVLTPALTRRRTWANESSMSQERR